MSDLRTKALLTELRAKVAECEAEHPPEPEYLAWCAAGKPDPRSFLALALELAATDEQRGLVERLEQRLFPAGLVEKLQASLGIEKS